ncbi:tetratricopeptide repeat protein [Halovulum sp. GXIMD14793]
MKILATSLIALSIATSAFAAGSDSSTPPKPTEATKTCTHGKVFDRRSKQCVVAKDSKLDDDTLYEAARELAYAGQYENALDVLNAAADQNAPRILTYKGFASRKAGALEAGMSYYHAALAIDPNFILARSYMGQALAGAGDLRGAKAQLAEIKARGGATPGPTPRLNRPCRGLARTDCEQSSPQTRQKGPDPRQGSGPFFGFQDASAA